MNIKTFEAYKYRGPELNKLHREKFIEELNDAFTDSKLFGYTVNGSTYFNRDEILWLHIDKDEDDGSYSDSKIIKLDLSDLGIEIGNAEWNDDTEEYDEFIPELNLDTDITKQIKKYKQDIHKFNV
jgi:hypothetical protein